VPRPGRGVEVAAHFLFSTSRRSSGRTGEDLASIAIGDLAAEQVLQASELLLGLLAHGELHAVAPWREGSDNRSFGWQRRRCRL
jgi:hypothetical protein